MSGIQRIGILPKRRPCFRTILPIADNCTVYYRSAQRFEAIHPFQDGNGRVGRLVLFKECLACGYVPFIITDDLKLFYYRGLQHGPKIREYLSDTCLTAQDNYKAILDYFKIEY